MPDPFSVTATVTVKAWLVKKGAEEAWKLINRHFTPDRLKKELELALSTNAAVAAAIRPLPTLDKTRLTEERVRFLLRTAITSDIDELAGYVCDEQLVDLPMQPEKKAASYDVVWRCIADAVLEGALAAIRSDERINREFLLYAAQSSYVGDQKIIGALETLKGLPRPVRDLACTAYDPQLRVSCSQIVSEPIIIADLDLSSPALLYGPPNLGKTCEAFRQAYVWEKRVGNGAVAYFLNASQHDPEILRQLVMCVDEPCPILAVIDDAHLADEAVLRAYCRVATDAQNQRRKMSVLWVSRDVTIAGKLSPRPEILEFSVDYLINRYLNAASSNDGLSRAHRVLAAVLTGLDPRVADSVVRLCIEPAGNNDTTCEMIAAAIDGITDAQAAEQLRRVRADLKSSPVDTGTIVDLYKAMLPAATLDCYLPRSFYISELGLGGSEALDTLILLNYATQVELERGPCRGKAVKLLEHPFQVKSLIDKVRFEEPALVDKIFGPSRTQERPALDAAVLAQFVLAMKDRARAVDRLKWLYRHAEWSGIPSCFLSALHVLRSAIPENGDSEVLRFATLRYLRKEERRVYKHNDAEVLLRLKSTLTEWLKLRDQALSSLDHRAEGYRLDSISYEAAYLKFMLGDFDDAITLFDLSIQEGLTAIDHAVRAPSGSIAWENGKVAFAHIWAAFTAGLNCRVMHLLDKWTRIGERGATVEAVRRLWADARRLLAGLEKANAAEASQSGVAYQAALELLEPRWVPVGSPDFFQRDNASREAVQALVDHHLNLAMTEHVLNCVPVVVGLTEERMGGNVARLPHDQVWGQVETDGLRTSHGMIIKYFYRGLWDASESDVASRRGKLNALTSAALMMGHFESESIGMALLATMRCLDDPQTPAGIRWILEHRCVPTGPTRVACEVARKVYG